MPDHPQAQLLEIGVIVKPHGLRGEVVVQLVTNRLERLDTGATLHCSRPAPRTPGDGATPRRPRATATAGDVAFPSGDQPEPLPASVEVLESRRHQGRHLVRFVGITTIEQAEGLRGAVLSAMPIEDPEAYFVHDLIGCEMLDTRGVRRGRVTAVEANPASDLLVVDDRHYVPLRFVTGRLPGQLVVDVPEGLFD